MGLKSRLFRDDAKLEAAAVSHSGHITPGSCGEHVAKIQRALITIDGPAIERGELEAQRYGPTTANAVLSYKQRRGIINPSYQKSADNIVGIMTIAALDKEMLALEEGATTSAEVIRCELGKGRGTDRVS
jgi:hypothetical protein